MNELPEVILKSGKDQSLLRFHPWVFSGAIKKTSRELQEGELVKVCSNKAKILGFGHYQIGSIAVRMMTFDDVKPDENFWIQKISQAVEFRKSLGFFDNPETNVFRLVHAEGDGLPGLIVDYYNGTAVLQMHSVGMYKMRATIVQVLKQIMGGQLKAVYDKSASTLPFKAKIGNEDEYVMGEPVTDKINEHGLQFLVDWKAGQKTGFYIDQRENRQLLMQYVKDKAVCNVFGYTGGFSVYALKGGAKRVDTVDSSNKAIDLNKKNVALNFPAADHHTFVVDAFDFLKDIRNQYDVIILDPPAFAKHGNVLSNALKGYKRINARAIEQIKPGGILFTFSCSQVVSKKHFREAVFSAAASTGRNVRILHQLSQPSDHPVNIYHPEGEYLKGLVLYVE